MKKTFVAVFSTLLAAGVFSFFLQSGGTSGRDPHSAGSRSGTAFAQEQGSAQVTFKVKCYDEGKAALQGMKGVRKIETGFHYLHEVDTVYYDPKIVTIDEMETALKKAGTYVETIKEKERN